MLFSEPSTVGFEVSPVRLLLERRGVWSDAIARGVKTKGMGIGRSSQLPCQFSAISTSLCSVWTAERGIGKVSSRSQPHPSLSKLRYLERHTLKNIFLSKRLRETRAGVTPQGARRRDSCNLLGRKFHFFLCLSQILAKHWKMNSRNPSCKTYLDIRAF